MSPETPIYQHIPVLLNEVLNGLNPRPGCTYLDGTFGGGGHSLALFNQIPPNEKPIQLIACDQDNWVLEKTRQHWLKSNPLAEKHTTFIHENYGRIFQHPNFQQHLPLSGGILLDLGVSSFQLDIAERGFSFRHNAPLDMRMDTTKGITAAQLIQSASEEDLVQIFSEYGEARLSKTIARRIIETRKQTPFTHTKPLADLIESIHHQILGNKAPTTFPKGKKPIHPATQIFQALRMAVNDELGHLNRFLDALLDTQSPKLLPGARIAIITFHSLEDRTIKRAFQEYQQAGLGKILTKKPVTASETELSQNPRARSAKLRIFEWQFPQTP